MIGLVGAAALLLGAAGLTKFVRRRGVVRLSGLVELLVAVLVLVVGGRVGAALLTVAYASLAAVSWRMMSVAPGQDCGCFGRTSAITHAHTAVNAMFALVGATALALAPRSVLAEVQAQQWSGIPLIVGMTMLAYLSYVLMVVYPDLLRSRAQVLASR